MDNQSPVAQVFSHHSARAACRVQGRVLTVNFSGAINQAGFCALDLAVMPLRIGNLVALERMDKALTMTSSSPLCDRAWPRGTPPSVVIVRDDQYAMASEFCAFLALRGVIRIVFKQSQTAMALRLVARIADSDPLPDH
jgi:hypothetical protein